MSAALACGLAVFVPMVAEAIVSGRHDRALRALGAVEPAGDVYRVMQAAYPGCFLAMLLEGAARGVTWDGLVLTGAILYAIAKALKYWAIASLGTRWTFRVLVPPRAARVSEGPYRWLRHPNYVAVGGELVAVALVMHALSTGVPAVALFASLMRRRIGVEENALAGR